MFTTGMVSITFRRLSVDEFIDVVKSAQLDGIEWGGDIHVPAGNLSIAAEVKEKTEKAGLKVLSYGSYIRFKEGEDPDQMFEDALASAVVLGAPVIRIWAGHQSPQHVSDEAFDVIVSSVKKYADMAKQKGITVAFECHWDTLTETTASILRLLKAVDKDNVKMYWQLNKKESEAYSFDMLQAILDHVIYVHVCARDNEDVPPFINGIDNWRKYLDVLHATNRDFVLLQEHVFNDSVEQFIEDGHVLKALVNAYE